MKKRKIWSSKKIALTYASFAKSQNIKVESVTGDTSFSIRMSVANFSDGKIDVLINYGVFTTGFDDPKIDCVVVARPLTQ